MYTKELETLEEHRDGLMNLKGKVELDLGFKLNIGKYTEVSKKIEEKKKNEQVEDDTDDDEFLKLIKYAVLNL